MNKCQYWIKKGIKALEIVVVMLILGGGAYLIYEALPEFKKYDTAKLSVNILTSIIAILFTAFVGFCGSQCSLYLDKKRQQRNELITNLKYLKLISGELKSNIKRLKVIVETGEVTDASFDMMKYSISFESWDLYRKQLTLDSDFIDKLVQAYIDLKYVLNVTDSKATADTSIDAKKDVVKQVFESLNAVSNDTQNYIESLEKDR